MPNNEYLNLFDVALDKDKLFNLSSGAVKKDDFEKLLHIWQTGKDQSDEFCTKRILSTEISFHDVIHRNKVPMFHTKKVIVKKDKTIKVINANRDIIGKLLILSRKHNKPIDLEGALTYPPFSVQLGLVYPDGFKREYQKGKLLPLLMPNIGNLNNTNGPNKVHCVYIMDMIAQLRKCFTNLSSTYEELIIRFL